MIFCLLVYQPLCIAEIVESLFLLLFIVIFSFLINLLPPVNKKITFWEEISKGKIYLDILLLADILVFIFVCQFLTSRHFIEPF